MPTFYTLYHKDRVTRVGGVLVAIHNSIPSQRCHTNNSIEMISVLLNTRPKLLLICLYIPPNCTSEFQQETLHAISNIQDVRTIILGDFNTPDINCYVEGHLSLAISAIHYIISIICNTPTHQAGNILDLILTNVPHRISNIVAMFRRTDAKRYNYSSKFIPSGARVISVKI